MDRLIGFEKLRVWQYSKDLAKSIYRITSSDCFPQEEKFGLISQMRRASISVASNIAEGSGRMSGNDSKRFITIAFGSAIELLNQLIISNELEFIDSREYVILRKEIITILAMLSGLKKSIK
jgi:four helix bundle protein